MSQVTIESQDGEFVQRIRAGAHGEHEVLSDEPLSDGGTNRGPTPYEFLLGALGTCMAITLRYYAERKGWPLESVRIVLNYDRIHAADCADCESETGYISEIDVALTLFGLLNGEQKQRLLEIASRCPVHKTLTHEIKIRTKLNENRLNAA